MGFSMTRFVYIINVATDEKSNIKIESVRDIEQFLSCSSPGIDIFNAESIVNTFLTHNYVVYAILHPDGTMCYQMPSDEIEAYKNQFLSYMEQEQKRRDEMKASVPAAPVPIPPVYIPPPPKPPEPKEGEHEPLPLYNKGAQEPEPVDVKPKQDSTRVILSDIPVDTGMMTWRDTPVETVHESCIPDIRARAGRPDRLRAHIQITRPVQVPVTSKTRRVEGIAAGSFALCGVAGLGLFFMFHTHTHDVDRIAMVASQPKQATVNAYVEPKKVTLQDMFKKH